MSIYEKKQTTAAPSQFDTSGISELAQAPVKMFDKQAKASMEMAHTTLENNAEIAMDTVSSKAYNKFSHSPVNLNNALTKEREQFMNSMPEGKMKDKFALKSAKKQVYYVDKAADNKMSQGIKDTGTSIINSGKSFSQSVIMDMGGMFFKKGGIDQLQYNEEKAASKLRRDEKNPTTGKYYLTEGQRKAYDADQLKALGDGASFEVKKIAITLGNEEALAQVNDIINSDTKEYMKDHNLDAKEYKEVIKSLNISKKVLIGELDETDPAIISALESDYKKLSISQLKGTIGNSNYNKFEDVYKTLKAFRDNAGTVSRAKGLKSKQQDLEKVMYKMASADNLKESEEGYLGLFNTTRDVSFDKSETVIDNLGLGKNESQDISAELNYAILEELDNNDISFKASDSKSLSTARNIGEEVSLRKIQEMYKDPTITMEDIYSNSIMKEKTIIWKRNQILNKPKIGADKSKELSGDNDSLKDAF